ncbi:MAG: hypothetical protein IJC50_03680 [Clostridia bacterium]|nr:hypothetical protein [Clostridia bacterium]
MREEFKIKGETLWVVTDDAVIIKGKIIPYDEIDGFTVISSPDSDVSGVAHTVCGGSVEEVNWSYEDNMRVIEVIKLIESKIAKKNN